MGRETRYRFTPDPLYEVQRWLASYERYWDKNLEKLRDYAENDAEDHTV